MKRKLWVRGTLALLASVVLALGCTKPEDKGSEARDSAKAGGTPVAENGKHEGWWCDEHGVPEAECSICVSDAKKKKMFKDKGDWCEIHNRAKSQCFICDPSLREKYAARYRAKYGKEPPVPEDNMPKADDKKEEKKDEK